MSEQERFFGSMNLIIEKIHLVKSSSQIINKLTKALDELDWITTEHDSQGSPSVIRDLLNEVLELLKPEDNQNGQDPH